MRVLPGFNHNIRHRGVLFHVQTEDGGAASPFVETHIFAGGNIVASRRRGYGKFLSAANLEEIVLQMMKEQHKEMLKELVAGRFKVARDVIAAYEASPGTSVGAAPLPPAGTEAGPAPGGQAPLGKRPAIPPPATEARPYRKPPPRAEGPAGQARPEAREIPTLDTKALAEKSLDELIMEFLERGKKP